MKKTIIFGSLIAVFLLLMIPNVSAIEYKQVINKRESFIQDELASIKEKISIDNENLKAKLFGITGDDVINYIIAIILTYAWFTPTLIQIFFTSPIGKILWTSITSILPALLATSLGLPLGDIDPFNFEFTIEASITLFITCFSYLIFSMQP